jgi:hypothetical protein
MAAKYFDESGWVGVKNRDRTYKANVTIKQSFRRGVERLFIFDNKSHYTEGLNEHGICILATTQYWALPDQNSEEWEAITTPLHGTPKAVRDALYEKDIKKAVQIIIDHKTKGNIFVFNRDQLFAIEGYNVNKADDDTYKHSITEIKSSDGIVVRANHNVYLDGNPPESKYDRISMKSSKTRVEKVEELIKHAEREHMLMPVSDTSNSDPNMNPLRLVTKEGDKHLRTTAQLMLIPAQLTLKYKPIWGKIDFDFEKLNSPNSKTFFEVISNKKLLSKIDENGKSYTSFIDWLKENKKL